MDLLYMINRKKSPKSNVTLDSLCDGQSLCKLSCRNIAAFTTTTELDDTSGKTWGCHVYVCDLNMPWHVHKVYSNKCLITALEWDLPGEKLVIADAAGWVHLWTFKDYLLNEWTLIGSHHFPGEYVLGAAWFHNGKKMTLVADKAESVQYNEKFMQPTFSPSVRQFGGQGAQGVLVVSTTGMLGTVMITQDVHNSVAAATESLGIIRQRITTVDLGYGKNGQFLVAVSSGNISQPIRCYRVLVRKSEERCSIVSHQMPSFFLQDGATKENPGSTNVMYLKFVIREAADSLVVGINSDNGGYVEIWELTEKSHPVHKFFQPKTLETFKTVAWQYQSQFRCHSTITAVATTKMSLSMTLQQTNYVIVALSDSMIHCLSHDGLKEVGPGALNSWRHEEPSNKYLKTSAMIKHIDVSSLGCIFLLCDTQGSLYVYKLLPEGATISLNYACTLLEYCLVTGTDWLDLLFCMRASMIEPLCDRLEASFNRQLPAVQQFYYIQFLSMKTSLYKMLASGQQRAADFTSLQMVHSVATAFKSLLRPSEIISHDKGPAESLALVITENINDVDKILLHLDPKEFTVEPSTLQSLQQLIQWVSDLALNLLMKLPEQRVTSKSTGYELLRDHKALNIIRELLVLIRIWGLLRPSCLPVFYRSADNLDVLALLFRLLSKLVQPTSETQPIDDLLIDECCLLPNQIMIPQLSQISNLTAVTTPVLFFQSLPMQFEYGIEPDINFVAELNSVEGGMHNGQVVDIVRHLYLGKSPYVVKQCTRCGGKSQVQNMTRTAAIRAWDQRWVRGCCCGGTWRIHKA